MEESATTHSHHVSNAVKLTIAFRKIMYSCNCQGVDEGECLKYSIVALYPYTQSHAACRGFTIVNNFSIFSLGICCYNEELCADLVQALMNLVNSSGLKVKQMFDRLQRRLKSADEKTLFMSGVKGEGRSHVQRRQKRRDQNRPPDKETSSINK